MSWVKLDDQARHHRKILAAGPVAAWMWACGLMYCNSQKARDGFIPDAAVPILYPIPGWRREAIKLVSIGLWDRVEGGYKVHDYHEYQPRPEADSISLSAKRAEAGRAGGLKSAEARRKQVASSNSEQVASSKSKLPSRPDPVPTPMEEDPPVVPQSQERPEGVTINLWRMHGEGKLFVDAYERAARDATKNQRWALRRPDDLRRVLESSCLGDERQDIEGWIDRHVRELVAFVRGLSADEKTYWKDVGPAEMQRWFNRHERGLKSAPSQPPSRDSKTRLKPTSAPEEPVVPMTPEEAAEVDRQLAELDRDFTPKYLRPDPSDADPDIDREAS